MAHFIDTATNEIDRQRAGRHPAALRRVHSRTERKLWVIAEIGGTVSVIDTETRKIIAQDHLRGPGRAPEAIQPVGVRITKDGKKAFVALGPANRVAVVDAEDL